MIDINRIYGLSIDLDKLKEFNPEIEFKQYDYQTSFIAFKFFKGDKQIMNIGDNYIIGVFKDEEGGLFVDTNGTPLKTYAFRYEQEEGVVILPINKEVINKVGNMACEILIIDQDGKKVTSPRFNFTIQPSLYDYKVENEIAYESICGTFRSAERLCGQGKAERVNVSKYISYEKTVWVDGETVVNQERLNNMEDGIYNVTQGLNNLNEDLSNYETTTNEHLSNIDKQLDSIDESLNNLDEGLNNVTQSLDNLDASHSSYETEKDTSIKTVKDALDKLVDSDSSSGGIYEGDEPPTDTDLIWYDTSDGSIDEKLDSLIIKELKSVISSLSSEITSLKEKVEYLWNNQGNGGSLPSEPSKPSEPSDEDCLLMENGSYLLLEDGSRILLEYSISRETAEILAEEKIDYIKEK